MAHAAAWPREADEIGFGAGQQPTGMRPKINKNSARTKTCALPQHGLPQTGPPKQTGRNLPRPRILAKQIAGEELAARRPCGPWVQDLFGPSVARYSGSPRFCTDSVEIFDSDVFEPVFKPLAQRIVHYVGPGQKLHLAIHLRSARFTFRILNMRIKRVKS
jgi:hypothetical protein